MVYSGLEKYFYADAHSQRRRHRAAQSTALPDQVQLPGDEEPEVTEKASNDAKRASKAKAAATPKASAKRQPTKPR